MYSVQISLSKKISFKSDLISNQSSFKIEGGKRRKRSRCIFDKKGIYCQNDSGCVCGGGEERRHWMCTPFDEIGRLWIVECAEAEAKRKHCEHTHTRAKEDSEIEENWELWKTQTKDENQKSTKKKRNQSKHKDGGQRKGRLESFLRKNQKDFEKNLGNQLSILIRHRETLVYACACVRACVCVCLFLPSFLPSLPPLIMGISLILAAQIGFLSKSKWRFFYYSSLFDNLIESLVH